MATKKKRLANSLRENSDAQASWGNKVRAPKVSDNGNAMVEGGRNRAAHAAGQSTVSTRARYVTAVSKNRRSGEKKSPASVSTAHKDYLRNERNIQNGVYSNGKSVRPSDKTKEKRGWEMDANRMYSKNHKTIGAYTRRSASTDKAQFNWANGMSNQAKLGARSNNKEIQKKMFERPLKSGSYAKGRVTDRIEQGGILGGDARYSSFYTSETGEKYAERFNKRKKKK